jgi:hypothetical protein
VAGAAPGNRVAVEAFARQLRESVDAASARLIASGQSILGRLEDSYNRRNEGGRAPLAGLAGTDLLGRLLTPYSGAGDLQRLTGLLGAPALPAELFGLGSAGPPPYSDFKSRLDRLVGAAETA